MLEGPPATDIYRCTYECTCDKHMRIHMCMYLVLPYLKDNDTVHIYMSMYL